MCLLEDNHLVKYNSCINMPIYDLGYRLQKKNKKKKKKKKEAAYLENRISSNKHKKNKDKAILKSNK